MAPRFAVFSRGLCMLFGALLVPSLALSAPGRPAGKGLRTNLDFSESSTYGFNFGSTVDDILTTSSDTNLYDPLTLVHLRVLQEEAQPSWNPLDIDPFKTRRVVEKAFAIQSFRSLSQLIFRSELRPGYQALRRNVRSVQDSVRYSLQDTGEDLTVSKTDSGEKLVELNMEFNLRQGLDPQLRVGTNFRLRYDYLEKRPLFEYGFDF